MTADLVLSDLAGSGDLVLGGIAEPPLPIPELSGLGAVTAARWGDGSKASSIHITCWSEGKAQRLARYARWSDVAPLSAQASDQWATPAPAARSASDQWQDAASLNRSASEQWHYAPRAQITQLTAWRDAGRLTRSITDQSRPRLPRIEIDLSVRWGDGLRIDRSLRIQFSDAVDLSFTHITRWRDAGYASYDARPDTPDIPDIPWVPPSAELILQCPLAVSGPVALVLGSVCSPVFRPSVPIRRSYIVLNTASLVRLPDRTEIPATRLTVSTDVDSWCWSLSANLVGPDFWDLVKPDSGIITVEAAINSKIWQFVLDWPPFSREFAHMSGRVYGRSRSALLDAPHTLNSSGVEAKPRNARQLAEQALLNTGWALQWDLVDWLVPGGLYAWEGTPIQQLIRIVSAVDGCLYTDPATSTITAYPRYGTAAWLWSSLSADLSLPLDPVAQITSTPDIQPDYNGVYVSGTISGAVALCKIAGTDGARLRVPMVVDSLLCDSAGVAARARGTAVLSKTGVGSLVTARTLLSDPLDLVLTRPGHVVNLDGTNGVNRATSISAERNARGELEVWQTLGIEQRVAA